MKRIIKALSAVIVIFVLFSSIPVAYVSAKESTTVYRSELNEIENAIYQGYLEMDSMIDLRTFEADFQTVSDAIANVLNKRTDIFYVGKLSNFYISRTGTIILIEPTYFISKDEIAIAKAQFDAAVSEIMSGFTDDMTDVQKLILIHDRIIVNASYNTAAVDNNTTEDSDYTAYGVLVKNTGVCESYSKAFKYCADLCGIENELISYVEMNHMWNQVKLDGNWYNVDATYDDPVTEAGTDIYFQVKHTGFLFSDTKATQNYGYISGYETNGAIDTTYDSKFWTKSEASFILAEDVCIYALKNGEIGTYDFETDTVTKIKSVSSYWRVQNNPGYYYSVKFVRPIYYNGYIYYNTPTEICTMRLDGTGNSVIYTYSADDRLIYGLGMKNGVAGFTVRTSPSESDYFIPLSETVKSLTAINVTTQPNKTVYLVGESLDTTGMVVTATYSDGSNFNLIASDYKISQFSSSGVGKQQLAITYGGKTCSLVLNVVENGDIDIDYCITSSDILSLQQHILALNTLNNNIIPVADIDKNGIIDSVDLLILQTKIIGVL